METTTIKPEQQPKNPGQAKPLGLISKHLGLEIENPPKPVPLNIRNRLKYRKQIKEHEDTHGINGAYLETENVYLFKQGDKNSGSALHTEVHELMHAALDRANPDYYRSVYDAGRLAVNQTREQGGDLSDTLDALKGVGEGIRVRQAFSEGLSEWGAVEVEARETGITDRKELFEVHAGHIDKQAEKVATTGDIRMVPYVSGHAFVTGAISYMTGLGMENGEALKVLLTDPPTREVQMKMGGQKYVAEFLMHEKTK